ncbi:Nucleolar protein 6 [Perkinsus chesapeaki]|uniref:Nucleolar protein 6 n=1 Tax=Perkinsus chesapeaki TaxID=330153 RepID=A0A7J6LI64_PERCH|nr:Nucleolar protein 6 [Perkinsus chesapeaki]
MPSPTGGGNPEVIAQAIVENNENRTMHRSNLLRLQLDELLSSSNPNWNKLNKLDRTVKEIINRIKSTKKRDLGDKFEEEFPKMYFYPNNQQHKFVFYPPKDVQVIGSYSKKACTKPRLSVDIAVVIPAKCLQSKDYLNGRYLNKRNAYVGELKRQLMEMIDESKGEIDIGYLCGDRAKPIVEICPKGSAWVIRLLPCINDGTDPTATSGPESSWLARLGLDRNCYREDGQVAGDHPTPLYNSEVAEDILIHSSLSIGVDHPSQLKAVTLLKIWAYQRGFLYRRDAGESAGLAGYHIAAIVEHVVSSSSLPQSTSAYQIFKLALVLLSSTDWKTNALVLGSQEKEERSLPKAGDSAQLFAGFDRSYNIFWRISLVTMSELSLSAKHSLELLDDPKEADPFMEVFGESSGRTLRLRWDFAITFPMTGTFLDSRQLEGKVNRLLGRALNDRLKSLAVRRGSKDSVVIGGILDSEHTGRLLDKGPSPKAEEAEAWRELWGPKSQLRRFKDGTMLECCVWDGSSEESAEGQIIEHVLNHHDISYDHVYVTPLGHISGLRTSDRNLWANFELLRNSLMSMEEVPLAIKDVRPSDPAFSYTSIDQDGPHISGLLEIVIELESNAAWPTKPEAIIDTKLALLLKIREGLLVSDDFSDVNISATQNPLIDVHVGGRRVTYRCRMWHREEVLQLATTATTTTPSKQRMDWESLSPLRTLWYEPTHRNWIHSMTALYPCLAPAIRAAKRWLDQRLLLRGVDLDNFAELSMMHVITSENPQSPHTAMLLWLKLIESWHRTQRPVYLLQSLTPGEDGDEQSSEEAQNLLMKLQSCYEAVSVSTRPRMWISSRLDPHCLLVRTPSSALCQRMASLATASLKHALNSRWDRILKPLPSENLSSLDVVITLTKNKVDVSLLQQQCTRHFGSAGVFLCGSRGTIMGIKWRPGSSVASRKQLAGGMQHLAVTEDLVVPNYAWVLKNIVSGMCGGVVKNVKMHGVATNLL